MSYFFLDASDVASQSILLPQDIGTTLQDIATTATTYKIFVRTGRHFRAEILPILVKQARLHRRPTQIDVILLDLGDTDVCRQYTNYRRASSFDKHLWDVFYVKKEILATILLPINASHDNPDLLNINLFLSKRLSTFRIEGSSDQILITREDPKDTALRYFRTHRNFSAYVTELSWICDEAYRIAKTRAGLLPGTFTEMFRDNFDIESALESAAKQATLSGSPYVR